MPNMDTLDTIETTTVYVVLPIVVETPIDTPKPTCLYCKESETDCQCAGEM